MLLTKLGPLDELLHSYSSELGADFAGYRNHAYRVANLCAAYSSYEAENVEKIAIAAAFHDMGIWTGQTFDYLRPSIDLAKQYLTRSGRAGWIPEVQSMILEHHKVTPYRGNPGWLVEPFRRADWVDVSMGLLPCVLPRRFVQELFSTWPGLGFHMRLVQLSLKRLRTHPLSPLPMMRW